MILFPLLTIIIAVGAVAIVNAIAPPYPELSKRSAEHRTLHETLFPNLSYYSQPLPSGIWESATEYKRRLQHKQAQTGNADDPVEELCKNCQFSMEICRYLSGSECEEIENAFVKHAAKTQTVSKTQKEIRTLVILVLWRDQQNRRDWMTREKIDHLWNGKGSDEHIPTGSIKNYTETQVRITIVMLELSNFHFFFLICSCDTRLTGRYIFRPTFSIGKLPITPRHIMQTNEAECRKMAISNPI